MNILCIASYEKGHDFLRECKRQGAQVYLLTSLSLRNEANWPMESLADIFYMPDRDKTWNRADTILAISHLARTRDIDRIVPLDDFDLEMAASIREHLRTPGMGETTTRYFRDKLAMRVKAMEAGLTVPEFVHLLNDAKVREFTERVPPPWVLKPRMLAGAIGIKKVRSAEQLHEYDAALGDQRSFYLVERFVPGEVCHVDSIVYNNQVVYASASRYGNPPIDVAQDGGIFTSRLLDRESEESKALIAKNARVLEGMGLARGVSHTEFIQGYDGKLYFLETSARVGGAHIADLIEAATGINMWAEWAKIEIGGTGGYQPPIPRNDYAALLVSLSKQAEPDTSAYNDPEIVWRMKRRHHVGMIVKSESRERVHELLDRYVERIRRDFYSSEPAREKPTS
jgi:biotin carboxylase